jgi:hypothetical protein
VKASELVLPLAIMLGLVYVALALATLPHLRPEKRKEQREWLLGLTLWWPFYADLYDGSVRERRLRLWGKLLLVVDTIAYVVHFAWIAR